MITRANSWRLSTLCLMVGSFFAAYQEFRPFEILFTYSDLFFLLGGFILLLEHGLNLRPFGSFTPLWYLSVGIMLTALLISSVVNGVVDRWPIVASQYAFAYVVLASVIVTHDPGRWRALALAFLAGIIVMEVVTFAIYFYYDENYAALTARFTRRFMTGAGRIGSFVGNPNYHAALIACTLPFVYYFAAKRWLPLWIAALSFVILVVALLYTA